MLRKELVFAWSYMTVSGKIRGHGRWIILRRSKKLVAEPHRGAFMTLDGLVAVVVMATVVTQGYCEKASDGCESVKEMHDLSLIL